MRRERTRTSMLLITVLALGAGPAAADEPAKAKPVTGSATRAWLELQRSGRQAGPLRPMPSEAGLLVYRQYVDSFKPSLQEFLTNDLPSLDNR